MISLLRLLRENEETVEADLQRYYQIDYRDRWRAGLTLRRLLVLIRGLPPDSATLAAKNGLHWTLEAHLLDDLRMVTVGSKRHPAKPHSQRPLGKKKPPTSLDRRRLSAGRQRRLDRLAAIERGDIT